MKNPDILCLGEPMVEFNRQTDGTWLQGFGGDVSNVAIAAARQGAHSGMLTQIGTDRFGDALMKLWTDEGVTTDHVGRDPNNQTGIYFVDHDADGHHFSYYRRTSPASLMTPDMLNPAMFTSTGYFHISAISQAISNTARHTVDTAIELAKSAGMKISYDTNLRLALWPLDTARDTILSTLGKADIVLPGLDDARQITGLSAPEAIAEFCLQQGANIIALTLGAEGALIATPSETRIIPGYRVSHVDATGAGDVFDGAFLARLVAGDDVFTAAAYANAAAALSTTGYGAIAPIPTAQQVRAFMAAQ